MLDRPRTQRLACAPLLFVLAMLAGCGRESAQAGAAGPSQAAEAVAAEPAPSAKELGARIAELERQLASERDARASEQSAHAEASKRLRDDLGREQEQRIAREREWLAYTEALAALDLPLPADVQFATQGGPQASPQISIGPEVPSADAASEEAARARSAGILRSLHTLLAMEQVRGLDLLECGTVKDGATGPVVFRLLDGDGRLAGSLFAERLRLEGSRAAKSVTLVLEDGYETRAGVKSPFEGAQPELGRPGVRRVLLGHVDPVPWLESLPELFGATTLESENDDGLWNLTLVRQALNQLLREDASSGWYRLRELGGVKNGVLREVQVERFESDGKLERRLFADRLTIVAEAQGIQLLLEEGAQMRGDEKIPFLDGRFRIFLPRAKHEDWKAAGLPGLAQVKPAAGG
jgi:hypothetical protein